MSKRQLIDEIRQHNPTAQPKFLSQFDDVALQQYLDNLLSVARKRAHSANWAEQSASVKIAS